MNQSTNIGLQKIQGIGTTERNLLSARSQGGRSEFYRRRGGGYRWVYCGSIVEPSFIPLLAPKLSVPDFVRDIRNQYGQLEDAIICSRRAWYRLWVRELVRRTRVRVCGSRLENSPLRHASFFSNRLRSSRMRCGVQLVRGRGIPRSVSQEVGLGGCGDVSAQR